MPASQRYAQPLGWGALRDWGTKLCTSAFLWSGEIAMSVLSAVLTGWLVFNGAVFAALLSRRPRPELRSRLFLRVLRSDMRLVRALSRTPSSS
jgi:hypothetical protein